jgi:2-polyprenyl-3-methyl-5-hydroxy-6-metoxy-1,4-benzoquinol methylase
LSMPLFLRTRKPHLNELMENPGCNPILLANTFNQFSRVNELFSGWRRIYRRKIRPIIQRENREFSLLDVGFGAGDIPIYLYHLACRDGFRLRVTAIDTDPRSVQFATNRAFNSNLSFLKTSVEGLSNLPFDFVISNNLVHHLSPRDLLALLSWVESGCSKLAIFNDIERSDWSFFSFAVLAPFLFRDSFVSKDGLTSIRRSYTQSELIQDVGGSWAVSRLFPSRLLLTREFGAQGD